jgi:hypothetical protein
MSEYDSIVTKENSDIENNLDSGKIKKDKYKYNILYCIIFVFILYGIYLIYLWDIITININLYNMDNNDLTARFSYYHHHHRKTCEDFEFGCCEIKDEENKTHILSLHRIIKYDKKGSNCPSFHILINKYIKYIQVYYSDSIVDCNIEECCKKYDITIPTKKCPSSYELVYEYNNGYNSPYQGLFILLLLLLIMFCLLISNK